MPAIQRRYPREGSESWNWPDGTHPVLRQVLSRRDISSPEDLKLALGGLIPVGSFGSLDAAIELLLRHRSGRILIVGDFDADGATSTALMLLGLRALGFGSVDYFVPDRFSLGYGLSAALVTRIASRAPSLIITVDNGISSHEGVAAAQARGIEVLITDHHLPPEQLPSADAIVNPNLRDEDFPGKSLAGVGVAFYLLAALAKHLGQPAAAAEFLDLVALGTVADLVPLDRCNRILVQQGLLRIRAGRCRPGIRALCEVAGLAWPDLTESALGFQLGPRLNAAGRLDDMSLGIRCLISSDDAEAIRLARELDELNRARRKIEGRMKDEAATLVDLDQIDATAPNILCLFRDDWHEGLVGLVASRIKDRLHRPIIAFAPSGSDDLKGSGRSVPGFHLRDALAEIDALHPGLIHRFGGHAMAAGLTLARSGLELFRQALEDLGDRRLTPELLAQQIYTDGELDASAHTLEVALLLREAGPWGQGFPEPSFDGMFELLQLRELQDRHLQMRVRPMAGTAVVSAIAFNQQANGCAVGDPVHLVYRLAVNDYGGTRQPQLIVEQIAPAAVEAGHRNAC